MNAVYNGNFSLSTDCSELKAWNNADINGTSYLTGIGSGYSRAFAASTWQNYFYAFNQTESSFGTRTAAYIIFKDNAGKSARTSVFRYGQIQGYTMPLKNGTTYRLLYDAAPWGTSNEAVIMGIADATGNVLATDTLTLTNDIYTSDAIANKVVANHGELIFTPKVDGDYTLTMASGDTRKDFNIAVSNISIFSISTSITYTVPEKGHGTIMLPFAASLPEGWKAYSCRSTEGVAVVLSDPTETLEACTPYIIEAKGGDQHTFTGLYASTHTTATDGLLTGTLDAFTVPQGSYALQTQNGLFGFYRTTTDPIVTPSYSAFLTPTGTDAADRLFFTADIPTGIDIVTNSNAIVNIYCPDGRLASRSTTLKKALSTLKPGIYISGGHKIIVK